MRREYNNVKHYDIQKYATVYRVLYFRVAQYGICFVLHEIVEQRSERLGDLSVETRIEHFYQVVRDYRVNI